MKTNILIAVLALSGIVSAAPVKAANRGGDCKSAYSQNGRFYDAATHMRFLRDVVTELTLTEDGGAIVAFQKTTRRYAIPAGDKAMLKGARVSFTAGTPVNIAFVEPADAPELGPDTVSGNMLSLQWLDTNRNHPACSGS